MTNTEFSAPEPSRSKTKYIFAAFALVLLIVLISLIMADRVASIYALYFSYDQFKSLYYERLGFSESNSEFLTVVTQFVYAVAWIPLTAFLVSWRLQVRKLLMGFLGWMVVYGSAPLAMSLLGSDICFNQSSGVAQKWYTEDPAGNITLFDSGGFTSSGESKKIVTPQVCQNYLRQQGGYRPQLLAENLNEIEFFDSVTGAPKVWYSKSSDGEIQLFDKPGFDPASGEPLTIVTREIISELRVAAARKSASVSATQSERTQPGALTSSSGRVLSEYSNWLHNGSTMYLASEGAVRRIFYRQPRPGMLEAGAKPNRLLFEGAVSESGVWRGSAYIFHRKCGAFPYAVSGYLDPRTGIIQLNGAAPRIDSNCQVISVGASKNDTLIFTPTGE